MTTLYTSFKHRSRKAGAGSYESKMVARFQRTQQELFSGDGVPDFDAIASKENFAGAFYLLEASRGQAAGPDRIRYEDYGRSDVWDLARGLSTMVKDGTYHPGAYRDATIPKSSGKGKRTLHIANIADRVVHTALNEAMKGFWEYHFLDQSYGFRPKRSHLQMLAHLEAVILLQGCQVLAIDDVKDAFNHVQVDRLLDFLRRYLPNGRLLNLITSILRGSDGNRKEGIDQGGAYSPCCLNVYLHEAHDLALQGSGANQQPWARYADNLVYPCKGLTEGTEVLNHVEDMLQKVGMSIKRDCTPCDLAGGDTAKVLGFDLTLDQGQVRHSIGPDHWDDLYEALRGTHSGSNPSKAAQQIVYGWITNMGPTFEYGSEPTLERIITMTHDLYLDDHITRPVLQWRMNEAYHRWNSLRWVISPLYSRIQGST